MNALNQCIARNLLTFLLMLKLVSFGVIGISKRYLSSFTNLEIARQGRLLFESEKRAQAEPWLLRASSAGHADSQYFLGVCMSDELKEVTNESSSAATVLDDIKQAKLQAKARKNKASAAKNDSMVTHVIGKKKSGPIDWSQSDRSAQAEHWLREASKQGHGEALCFLGNILMQKNSESGTLEAIQCYEKASTLLPNPQPDAIFNLASLYFHGKPPLLQADISKSLVLFHKAADKFNDIDSQYWLGHCYLAAEGGVDMIDLEKGLSYLNKAGDGGHPQALYYLATLYRSGLTLNSSDGNCDNGSADNEGNDDDGCHGTGCCSHAHDHHDHDKGCCSAPQDNAQDATSHEQQSLRNVHDDGAGHSHGHCDHHHHNHDNDANAESQHHCCGGNGKCGSKNSESNSDRECGSDKTISRDDQTMDDVEEHTSCGGGACCHSTSSSSCHSHETETADYLVAPDPLLFRMYLHLAMQSESSEAWHCMGDLLLQGTEGVAQDHAKAIEMFEHARSLGSAEAALALGVMHYTGMGGLEPSATRAFEMYNEAAEYGSSGAWRNLAAMYFTGDGVAQSEHTAREIMRVIFNKTK